MQFDQIISAIGLVGIGGLLKSGFDYLIESRKAKDDSKHVFKETRYKTIILLCFALVNYEKEKTTLVINRPDITSIDRLKNDLHAEFINMTLFASDKVIISLRQFLQKQNKQTLNHLALTMRKDLYGIKSQLTINHLDIDIS